MKTDLLMDLSKEDVMKKFNYYIGMDVHKKNSYLVVISSRGKVLKRVKVKTEEGDILKFVRSLKGSKALVLEETSMSQWVYLLLINEVDHLVVCDSAANNRKRGPKTDFLDAFNLADLLRGNRLTPVFHSADKRMELRSLVSGYQDLIQEITRAKNRFNALFRQSVIKMSRGNKKYKDAEAIQKLPNTSSRFVAKQLLDQISLLEEQKKTYHAIFKRNVIRFPEMRLLTTIPGIGPVWANVLVAIIIAPERFGTKYRFWAYSRLTRHKQRSDGKSYGNKHSYGNNLLKSLFKGAARSALLMKNDNAMKREYERVLNNKKRNTSDATNAVARVIASTVLGVWKSGKNYDDNFREVSRREELKIAA